MADQSMTKNFDFKTVSEFGGYVSSVDKTKLSPEHVVSGSQNVFKKDSGTWAVREGQKRLGAADSTLSAVSSEFVWRTSWGAEYPLWISNSKLQVYIGGTWLNLLTGLTATRYVFDKWWDNTEKKDRVLFVNGSDDLFHWSGGYTTISSKTVNTITKTGTTTWQQAGFSTTVGEKTVVINGTTYTYTGGETTLTLTGVTPDPTGEANGSNVLQAVQTTTNTPAANFANDFIKVINNQLYVGSYTSRLCYISSNTDFKNFTVTVPRLPGGPELLTLDSTLKGIGVRQGNAHIGVGTGQWAVVSFNDITVGTTLTQTTKVDVKPVSNLAAPYAHEFIDTVGDSIVYLAQDQQVRMFGDFANLFTPKYPSISQQIKTELEDEVFTGGSLKCIGDLTYLCAPNSGKSYLYKVREKVDTNGNVVGERLWFSPFVWGITTVDIYAGVVYGFSSQNPQMYQLWDTNQWYDDCPSDEQLPYSCVLAFAYRTTTNRADLQHFDKAYSEGYFSLGTPLNLQINYNYEGFTNQISVPVNSDALPGYTFAPSVSSLGDESLGDSPLGDGLIESGVFLPKFKVINSLADTNCFEWQPIYYSDDANARWEILATGSNAQLADEQPVYIINKRRT